MAKKSALVQKLAHEREVRSDLMEKLMMQFMFDLAMLTLHEEFGFGEERGLRFHDEMMKRWEEFRPCLDSKNVEADVLREHIDRRLNIGGDFIPFEERYWMIKEVTYGKGKVRK